MSDGAVGALVAFFLFLFVISGFGVVLAYKAIKRKQRRKKELKYGQSPETLNELSRIFFLWGWTQSNDVHVTNASRRTIEQQRLFIDGRAKMFIM